MKYTVGQVLKWIPDLSHKPSELVEVVELRRGGKAKLSNGWLVDEDGIGEGTRRLPGGRVEETGPVDNLLGA